MNFLKKFTSIILSGILLSMSFSKVLAQVEVLEFDDNTKITRFNRDDFETMIKLYDGYTKEKEKHLFTKGENIAVKASGAVGTIGSLGLAGYLWNKSEKSESKVKNVIYKIGAGVAGLAGVATAVGVFYPEYKKSKVEKDITKKARNEKTWWIGVKDIRDMLIEERDTVEQVLRDGFEDRSKQINMVKDTMPELIPLMASGLRRENLQKYPGYYVLIERPYRDDNYVGSDTVYPRLCKDYELRSTFAKDGCSGWISDLINRLESEGIHGKEYKKISIQENDLKALAYTDCEFFNNHNN
ncbi:MAG: hypothetical protein Q4B84_04550 [Clostridia bacterium]|nr:hypothetical protein [Clostridia bacterium]